MALWYGGRRAVTDAERITELEAENAALRDSLDKLVTDLREITSRYELSADSNVQDICMAINAALDEVPK